MSIQDKAIERIYKLARTIRRRPAENRVISRGGYLITNAVMKEEGIRALDLVEKLDLRPATLSVLLKKLEKSGYIYREQDASDARIFHVYSTKKAHIEHENWVKYRRHYSERLKTALTDEEAEQFCVICDKICDFFEKEYSEDTGASLLD